MVTNRLLHVGDRPAFLVLAVHTGGLVTG